MRVWHGGRNLTSKGLKIVPGKGKWEYGPGLYCHTDVNVAMAYAKGGRSLYQIELNQGVALSKARIDYQAADQWIRKHLKGALKAEMSQYLKVKEFELIPVEHLVNLCINTGSSNAKSAAFALIEEAGIDYHTERALGNSSGFVVVVFNARIIDSIEKTPQGKIQSDWLLSHQEVLEQIKNLEKPCA